jgi:DNA (cytosine-5)-methyltransferase 1
MWRRLCSVLKLVTGLRLTAANWSLYDHLPVDLNLDKEAELKLRLGAPEAEWIEAWNDSVRTLRADGATRLPGFPVWRDAFVHRDHLAIPPETPAWKADFLQKNSELYTRHLEAVEDWLERWNYLEHFPPSRRKFEWQAQDAPSLSDTLMHLRPSGLRAKRPTYVPALVAITQTSILGDLRRRLSPREAARLQGLPEWFDFGDQPDSATYKQMGNGVNVSAAYYVLRQHVLATLDEVRRRASGLAEAVAESAESPDAAVERYWDVDRPLIARTRAVTGHAASSRGTKAAV